MYERVLLLGMNNSIEESLKMSDFDVRSSFVSVVDHLPSDVIRKLWLIQTLNINYESLKDELDMLLKEIKQSEIPKDTYLQRVSKINSIANELKNIRQESLEEAKSISSTIKITKLNLLNQYSQLQQDKKTHEQELINNGKNTKRVERTNKRTSTKSNKPIIKLKLNLAKKDKPSTILKIKKPGRGRPPKKLAANIQPVVTAAVVDPDDEIYCLCRSGSYGEMIACDNPKCKYEWFHYSCVGLTRAPRGKWNCPLCKDRKRK